MWLVHLALRRPITILVVVLSIALGSALALRRMSVDIFPQLGAPAIYVAQPYGGMSPSQMEGYLTYYYEYHFLFINALEHVESKNIQGMSLMKLVFHEGTDMNRAMAETIGYVNRARAFMPPGAVPPFIMRFDAGSVPVVPFGNVRTGDLIRIASTNTSLGGNIQELVDTPVRTGQGPAVYLRDLATIQDSTDLVVGYAHVNGRRTVYIPVTKTADASTLAVIQRIRQALPAMRNAAPEDVSIDLVFDQSVYVVNALRSLVREGILGAILTGLMVLLFLREWRSALIVVTTIPVALLSAVVWLWAAGETINIMTLGGLALAVGVLVDEATVEIENIHSHMTEGRSRAASVLDACRKTAIPRLLSMLCILSVFVPAFFMVGVGRQLFVPLTLAVGFAMFSSYVLSSTLVPVLSAWFIRQGHKQEQLGLFEKFRSRYSLYLNSVLRWL